MYVLDNCLSEVEISSFLFLYVEIIIILKMEMILCKKKQKHEIMFFLILIRYHKGNDQVHVVFKKRKKTKCRLYAAETLLSFSL